MQLGLLPVASNAAKLMKLMYVEALAMQLCPDMDMLLLQSPCSALTLQILSALM